MDNLKGNYDEERISSIAVGIDIKKELEAKLHPSYADQVSVGGTSSHKFLFSAHSDETLVRRPRLGRNAADFTQQVEQSFSKCQVSFANFG